MDITAIRTGDWWALEAEYQGQPVYSQARRLDQAETMVRDAFAILEVDLGDEPVRVVPQLSADLARDVAAARDASAAAEAALREASALTRSLVTGMRDNGFTVRDVAAVMDLSPQRISQLARTQVNPSGIAEAGRTGGVNRTAPKGSRRARSRA
ncbi:hypothetical protein JQN72_05290 [Phycicoccus sp. CSK15P-2]|uniref:hypothetical protein n=1 Tax=Phycicoccus sp. CSK15P-2 TaxID=2807627 RepID=UPI001951ABF6|nr:hypothetical protein [Phycicoccus sp. CSK15P-2]MBM6403656.1 hypothetical protein [Phycicoccus sp. CSK15P-2]